MTRRSVALIALTMTLLLAACAGNGAADVGLSSASEAVDSANRTTTPTAESAASDADSTTEAESVAESASSDADSASGVAPASEDADSTSGADPASEDADSATGADSAAPVADATATPLPLATRVGSEYVLLLPREDAVPTDWAMSPPPDFQTRTPGPDDTYRFACRDLPARSIGIATVGYRHLDGLPSVAIEYVIYASADDAAAALADMRAAAEECGDFAIGQGNNATAATLAPLAFDALGDAHFAAALSTRSDTSGDLLIHLVKVRQGHVVIGISHTAYADGATPDAALTRALAEQAVNNLRHGPAPTGPSAN